jgi:extracellular elastinolytic metalloproteinase
MEDNWYEAAVSANSPLRIVSVVDWASDSSFSYPNPKPNTASVPVPPPVHKPATYNVFKWGINDPSVGNRTLEKEYVDSLASPVGWHSFPFANDPSGGSGGRKDVWKNTSDTSGNNVSEFYFLVVRN